MKKTIGERLQDLMKESGITQRELSKELKISAGKMNDIINDSEKDIGYRVFIKIAKYFNVSTDYLFGIDDTGLKTKNEIVTDHLMYILDIISFMARNYEDIGARQKEMIKIVLRMK